MSHTRYLKALFNDIMQRLEAVRAFLACCLPCRADLGVLATARFLGEHGGGHFRHHLRGAGEQRQND